MYLTSFQFSEFNQRKRDGTNESLRMGNADQKMQIK